MAKLKLSYPEYRHAASVTCGSGSLRSLVAVAGDGDCVFLTSASGDVLAALGDALGRAGVELDDENHLCKPPGEPTLESVSKAGAWIAARRPRRLIAVGGGSVLDWARLGWAAGAGRLDLEQGRVLAGETDAVRPAIWLVPTTCGTGAEAADVAVYQSGARKIAVLMPEFMADRVILDGKLLTGLDEPSLAGFTCDALSHAVEASLSLVPMRLGKRAAASALAMLLKAYGEADSPSRREALMEGSFLGGVAAANCSVGVVHAFAHAIGPDGVAHGLANACGLLDGLQFNADTPQMAALLDTAGYSTLASLQAAIEPVVQAALTGLGPDSPARRLADAGYREQIADRMLADVAIRTNPRRPADRDELEAWLGSVRNRLGGR